MLFFSFVVSGLTKFFVILVVLFAIDVQSVEADGLERLTTFCRSMIERAAQIKFNLQNRKRIASIRNDLWNGHLESLNDLLNEFSKMSPQDKPRELLRRLPIDWEALIKKLKFPQEWAESSRDTDLRLNTLGMIINLFSGGLLTPGVDWKNWATLKPPIVISDSSTSDDMTARRAQNVFDTVVYEKYIPAKRLRLELDRALKALNEIQPGKMFAAIRAKRELNPSPEGEAIASYEANVAYGLVLRTTAMKQELVRIQSRITDNRLLPRDFMASAQAYRHSIKDLRDYINDYREQVRERASADELLHVVDEIEQTYTMTVAEMLIENTRLGNTELLEFFINLNLWDIPTFRTEFGETLIDLAPDESTRQLLRRYGGDPK